MSTILEVKDYAGANHEESGSQVFQRIHGHFVRRQGEMLAIPTTYMGLNSGPSPGVIVGIILGSVAGFLLLWWLIYAIFNIGGGFSFRALRRRNADEVVINTGDRRRSSRRRASDAPVGPLSSGGADEDVIEVIEVVEEGRRRRRHRERPIREYARHVEEESPAEVRSYDYQVSLS
jgi:hypothetical protein